MTNAFTDFQNLIKGEGKAVVDIVTRDLTANTSTGTTSSGVTVNLVGSDVEVGKKAYVIGYDIIGVAPDKSIVTLEV